jgi:hypothetical protein
MKTKQVYSIMVDNGTLGYVYECPDGKIRHTTNKRVLGGNIVSWALKDMPVNVKLTLTFTPIESCGIGKALKSARTNSNG